MGTSLYGKVATFSYQTDRSWPLPFLPTPPLAVAGRRPVYSPLKLFLSIEGGGGVLGGGGTESVGEKSLAVENQDGGGGIIGESNNLMIVWASRLPSCPRFHHPDARSSLHRRSISEMVSYPYLSALTIPFPLNYLCGSFGCGPFAPWILWHEVYRMLCLIGIKSLWTYVHHQIGRITSYITYWSAARSHKLERESLWRACTFLFAFLFF